MTTRLNTTKFPIQHAQNTDPDPPPVFKKPSPPPPPPKAEPIWYNCSVVVESHCSSKELDDLEHGLGGFDRMAKQGGNYIKIGLPGESILGDYFQEIRTSGRPFLLLRISFLGRPIFIQFIPAWSA